MTRPLREIAREIRKDWPQPYVGAVPSLEAMSTPDNVDDPDFTESARTQVMYFLANAGTWRGETARRVKAELKGILK